jgi:hypothetical protein
MYFIKLFIKNEITYKHVSETDLNCVRIKKHNGKIQHDKYKG